MQKMIKIFLGLSVFVFFIVGMCLQDWLTFKLRGYAKPDDPDSKNYPIITGPSDAEAHWTVDRFKKPEDPKK